jgi:hypothetical protein
MYRLMRTRLPPRNTVPSSATEGNKLCKNSSFYSVIVGFAYLIGVI